MSTTQVFLEDWNKVKIFAQMFPADANRQMVTSIQTNVKKTSGMQQQKAPRRTGFMASNTVPVMLRDGAEAVSKAHYAVFVDRGTRYMPARPFFTENMNKMKSVIVRDVNLAFANTIKKYFV